MAAGFATIGGNAKSRPEEREGVIHVFGRDALQIDIAANRAVRVERIAEGHQAGKKASAAIATSPGVNSKNT